MIEYLKGVVKEVKDKSVTLLVNGLGLKLQVPQTKNIIQNKEAEFFSYMHWNADKGPSLFGFQDELEKTVFMLIIGCPKIGPSIAINILSQINAGQFLEIISSQNEEALSSINGIGPKKAEQIIMNLKHKVTKLLSSGELSSASTQQDFTMWQNINDVLVSLNYSKQEIAKTMQYLTEKHAGQNIPLDQLIRSALGFLSGNI